MDAPKLCYSKKIVIVSYTATLLLTLAVFLCVVFLPADTDLSPLAAVTALAWGESTTATGFYFWKAKNEKKLQLIERMTEKWADKYGIDAVTALAGIIINE